jgi:hypothetical protein
MWGQSPAYLYGLDFLGLIFAGLCFRVAQRFQRSDILQCPDCYFSRGGQVSRPAQQTRPTR